MPVTANYPFSLGVVTDEIHPDPEIALPLAAEMGFQYVEFNRVGERCIHELSDAEARDLAALVERHGLKTCALSPPAFKAILLEDVPLGAVANHPEFQEQLAWVARACELAPLFGTDLIRIFSFRRSPMAGLGNPSPRHPAGGDLPAETLEKIVAALRIAAGAAEQANLTLGVENVRSCWGNSGLNTARLLAAVDHPRVRAIWDPGNDYVSGGCPYPEGYEAVKPYIAHVHVKDAVVEDDATGLTRWERLGAGEVDFAGQLQALANDGYAGVLCVETHWREEGSTGEDCTRRTLAGLRCLLDNVS